MDKRKLGIEKIDDLYNFSLNHLQAMFKPKLGTSLYYYVQSYKNKSPMLMPDDKFDVPRGKTHLYIDFETSDEVHPTEPAHVWLIGL